MSLLSLQPFFCQGLLIVKQQFSLHFRLWGFINPGIEQFPLDDGYVYGT